MFDYDFLSLVYVNDDSRELEELLEKKIKEVANDMKKIYRKKQKVIYENFVESSLPTHCKICKVLKH